MPFCTFTCIYHLLTTLVHLVGKVTTNLENLLYSGISMDMEIQGILCNLRENI